MGWPMATLPDDPVFEVAYEEMADDDKLQFPDLQEEMKSKGADTQAPGGQKVAKVERVSEQCKRKRRRLCATAGLHVAQPPAMPPEPIE